MNLKIYLSILFFISAAVACSSTESTLTPSGEVIEHQAEADEYIFLNINEAIYFEFFKFDTTWSGNFRMYTLSAENERVVKSRYVSAQDSSWDDFDLFVDFLNLYKIPPQNEIEGWVPDSGQLPQRVYSFELFDGDTTRSFSYQDLEKGIRDYWESQNLLTFVTFAQNELRWVEKPD